MLKTAFIGNRNAFDIMMCEWLAEHTDLSLIVWSNNLSWSQSGPGRRDRVLARFKKRAKRYGLGRAVNEAAYYALYRRFIARWDNADIAAAVQSVERRPRKPLSEIQQLMPSDIKDESIRQALSVYEVDALFAMCIDVFLPDDLITTPRLGSYLWHEGITPEYRGVYSPFWTVVNGDADNLGYTLLKMNSKLDAGAIYVQGRAQDIDFERHWHSYMGHKSIIDSLPASRTFLQELEAGTAEPIERVDARDAYYSYPTATALLRFVRQRSKLARQREGAVSRVSV
jgi:Formyl transferase